LSSNTHTRIREFVVANFLFDDIDGMVSDDASLLESGIVDSTAVLDLICFLEDEFGIRVADSEVTRTHLDSIQGMAAYVQHKLEQHGVTSEAAD
jgi:acyl carrier protein